jgi:hypothetical protein
VDRANEKGWVPSPPSTIVASNMGSVKRYRKYTAMQSWKSIIDEQKATHRRVEDLFIFTNG